MRKHLKPACITVLLMMGALLSHISAWAEDPPHLLWSKTYSSRNWDFVQDVATDTGGNIIVVGPTFNGTNLDWLILKYNLDGSLLWSKTYDSGVDDYARGVVTDASDNIIVAGDGLIRKYSSDGSLLWSKTYDGFANKVAADSGSNIIVAGRTGNDINSNSLIRKYSSDGSLLWSKTYDGGADDCAYAVAADASGDIIIAGITFNGNNWDWLICKYSSDGSLLWSKTYDGGFRHDAANAVATDAGNNIIVAGKIYNYVTGYDWLIRKYSSDGSLLWSKTYDGGFDDSANGVTIDTSGNIIVVGETGSGTSSPDWLIRKYSSDGSLLWNKTYDGGYDYASDAAIDVSNNIIVVGQSIVGGNSDWLIQKYSTPASTSVTAVPNQIAPKQGDAVCIQVDVAYVSNLYAASFNLAYNPAVLDYTGITEGTFLNSGGQVSTSLQAAALNGNIGSGQIVVGISRMGDAGGASGSGRLASLCFMVTGNYCSTSDIIFSVANLEGPAQGSLITATWNHGSLTVTLGAPANPVTADAGTHKQVNLCWDGVSGASSYEVYRSNTAGGTYTLIGTTASTCYQDTGCILPTLNYYYQVKAISGGTCVSALSPEVSGLAGGLLGDINNDHRVDGRDLSRLGRAFGTGSDCRSDLNRSSLTDGEDLSLLAADFGKTM